MTTIARGPRTSPSPPASWPSADPCSRATTRGLGGLLCKAQAWSTTTLCGCTLGGCGMLYAQGPSPRSRSLWRGRPRRFKRKRGCSHAWLRRQRRRPSAWAATPQATSSAGTTGRRCTRRALPSAGVSHSCQPTTCGTVLWAGSRRTAPSGCGSGSRSGRRCPARWRGSSRSAVLPPGSGRSARGSGATSRTTTSPASPWCPTLACK
mmetsp:Transcript_36187/g.103407  ORF Transcript_36187/g.103407 Transcript_36187/m.103407 type:complete len:207 (-) Transcript_36187:405-1025(-)